MKNTKEKITNAYKQLVIENHTTKISVLQICEACAISRTTFYNHYKDVNDIVEEIFINDAVQPMLQTLYIDINAKNITYNWYLNFMKNKEFYQIAIKNDGQNSLFETIIEKLTEINCAIYSKQENLGLSNEDIEYLAYKYAASQAMLLKKWMLDGMVISPEKMMKYYLHDFRVNIL